MSKSTFKILFYLRRNYVNREGKAGIMIRITLNGDVAQFSSKLEVEPELWDVKAGRIAGKSKTAREMNNIMEEIRRIIRNHYHTIEMSEALVTAEKVKNAFLGIETGRRTLLDLYRSHVEDTKKLVGVSKSPETFAKYERSLRRIEAFMSYKYQISDIALKEISHMFITDYEMYLRTECKCNENTTAKFIQALRLIIIKAKNNGWIFADPFVNYKIRKKHVDRGYLSQQEIDLIIEKVFTCYRLEQVRDVFIFCCFTGLSYIDVKQLRSKDICSSIDNKQWIMTKRQKTKTSVNVPLLRIPLAILDKYKDKLPGDALLPVLSNQKLNAYLKEIADLCGINKNITFHMARHTFATTTTLLNGVPIETVSKMLGHTNIETTKIYARITNEKINRDMLGLSDKFAGSEKLFVEQQKNKRHGTPLD